MSVHDIHVVGLEPKAGKDMSARLIAMHEMAVAAKRPRTRPWSKFYQFYLGNQWGRRPKWRSKPVENHISAKIETMIPILTDNRPLIDVPPRSPEYMEYAEGMQQFVEYLWERNSMDIRLPDVMKDCLLFGKGILQNYWDAEDEEIRSEAVVPQAIFPSADAVDLQTCRYMSHVSYMPRHEIVARWPEAQGQLKPGDWTVPDPMAERRAIREGGGGHVEPGYQYAETVGGQLDTITPWHKAEWGSGGDSITDQVQVIQFWIRDPDTVVSPLRDRLGRPMYHEGKQVDVVQPKYAGGRHLVMVGTTIVHDDANPYEHGKFPYSEFDCHRLNGEFWPISMVANLMSPQIYLNQLTAQVLDNAKMMGDGVWIKTQDAGIDADEMIAKPGAVYTKTHAGSVLERIPGVDVPSTIINQMGDTRAALDGISGIFDVTQGRKPTGIQSGVAIESLQEAAQTRIRLLVRNMEEGIEDTGEQWIALAQQYHEGARMIRVPSTETGGYAFIEITPEMLRAQWEVRVTTGSTLPRSREARQREAVQLFELGVFDNEEFLKHIDHPGRANVLKRIQEAKDFQAELQAQLGEGNGQVSNTA